MSDMARGAPSPAPHLLVSLTMPVRWRDLDAFDHVNNASYLTYLEEARLHWFGQIAGAWRTAAASPVVAAAHANYRRQLSWPATLTVELFCERLGNSSLTVAFRIADAADAAVVYADGNTVIVWIDPASGRPVTLPDCVRRASSRPS